MQACPELDHEMRSQISAVAAMAEIVKRFAEIEPVQVSTAKLHQFLHETSSVRLSDDIRLVALASALQTKKFKTGWRGFSQIYELARELEPSNTGLLIPWIISGLDCWLLRDDMAEDEKAEVATDLSRLMDSLELVGDNSMAYLRGLLEFRSPTKKRDFSKALQYFRFALESCEDVQEAVLPKLYAAHCLFELRDLDGALFEYRAIDQKEIMEMSDVSVCDLVSIRISELRSLLSQG